MLERFWEQVSLQDLSAEQWESLCDRCGKCCLHKLHDIETDVLYYTSIVCRLYDEDCGACGDYNNRQQRVPDCEVLTPATIGDSSRLPQTCAYRRVANGLPLPDWHPLITGDLASTRAAGQSIVGRIVPEQNVPDEAYEDYVIRWVN